MADEVSTRTSEKVACSPEIRAQLGERLKAYYETMQDMPVPNHLTELIARLAERLDEPDSDAR